MEKETIIITITATTPSGESASYILDDRRRIQVTSTRGDVAKKIDEICADIEAAFEH